MKSEKVRSAVLIIRDEKVLLIERVKAGRSLYYVLPGGGIEAGETPQQAAVRELNEELGVGIIVESVVKDTTATDRETWIVRAALQAGLEPVWQEEHKQTTSNSYKAVWIPLGQLSTITIFPDIFALTQP